MVINRTYAGIYFRFPVLESVLFGNNLCGLFLATAFLGGFALSLFAGFFLCFLFRGFRFSDSFFLSDLLFGEAFFFDNFFGGSV